VVVALTFVAAKRTVAKGSSGSRFCRTVVDALSIGFRAFSPRGTRMRRGLSQRQKKA
jgi:hypothetical protein